MKIKRFTTNANDYQKNVMSNNIMYNVQELHTFCNHSKSNYKLFKYHEYLHYIL